MKKLLALCLTVALCLCCLTACDTFGNIFGGKSGVSKEYYENCAVFTFDDFESRVCITLDRTGLGEGTIYYQVNLKEGALCVKYSDVGLINENQLLSEFTADDEMPINGSGGYIEGDKIAITFEALSPVSGEIIIAFTEDALKAVHKDKELHEHTFTYTSAGKIGHYASATCGCPSQEGTTPHYDGDTDYICDFCKCDMTEFADEWLFDETHHWYVSDDEAVYCYGEHQNFDADLNCDICGYDMSEIPTPTNHFLRNQAGCEWLNEITAEDIAKIKIISEAVGVAPGNLKNISSSTDEAVIARIFEEYYWLDTAPISKMEGQIDGGGAVTVRFILKDGTEREIYINNGYYRDTEGNCFELLYIPKFEESDNVTEAHGFITYIGTGEVYDKDNNLVCEIPIDELEFDYDLDLDLPDLPPYDLAIRTEFGDLKFIAPDIFYMETGEACVLVGKNLDELIAYATSAEYSLTMNDEEWLYEDLKATYKAGETVTVKIEMAIDLGYLFLVNGNDIADCQDVDGLYWEYTFTMPACNVEIDFKTYDGFLPDWNYGILIESYWKQNLDADYVYIENYYGEFSGGAIVAMIASGAYDDAVWEETVGDTTIRYNNGNCILVLYEGKFYTLTAAYENGYLSLNDIKAISDLQKEYYPYLY